MKRWRIAAYQWGRANIFWIWQAGAFLLALLYTLAVIRPFADEKDASANLADIASSWNASISKLGISPLFPPQENFFVGDLWAIVSEAPESTYLGKGVRLAHVDLADSVRNEQKNRTDLEDVVGASQTESAKAGQTRLSMLAFPGVSISRTEDDRAASGLAMLGFSASRKVNVLDELKIPVAFSYGAEIVDALLRFYAFCGDKSTHIRCTERFARNMLATTLDEKISPNSPDAGKFKIRLQLVTRVYLATSILHKQGYDGGTSIIGSEGDVSKPGNSADSNARQLSHQGGRRSDVEFDEKFERPLVFGFRSAIFLPYDD
ncbi:MULTISPECIES: hypothetical protein [unclassified Bradyrhizobium]|uniref:hypothetical protein n=1 Tax=unclassified Bradyrhizobium TaxID=2631580 RepID=UPI0028EBC3FD|nr:MULTISPECIES: hypothetical protein [unclassified Bradyrhizobium]